MESYNAPKDSGYKPKSDYGSPKNTSAPSSGYGGSQQQTSLPIYTPKSQSQQVTKRRSRCPMGAALGEIGSCCGLNCTRACASLGN